MSPGGGHGKGPFCHFLATYVGKIVVVGGQLVEEFVDLGASPRATICWGRLVKVWALLARGRTDVYPEDVQDLAKYVLPHRVWLAPQAASQDVRVQAVIEDIVDRVPIP